MKPLKKWLNEQPDETKVKTLNGYPYLPVQYIRTLLDEMCEFDEVDYWGDEDFSYSYHSIDGVLYISGSLNLVIHYNNGTIRYLSGASTCTVDSIKSSGIDQLAGTINSMCLTFAAKKLGNKFNAESYIDSYINIDEGGKTFGKLSESDFEVFFGLLKGYKNKKDAVNFYANYHIELSLVEQGEVNSFLATLK